MFNGAMTETAGTHTRRPKWANNMIRGVLAVVVAVLVFIVMMVLSATGNLHMALPYLAVSFGALLYGVAQLIIGLVRRLAAVRS